MLQQGLVGWQMILALGSAWAGTAAWAGPGVIVGNGGGLAEQNFAYALANLSHVFDLCDSRITECLPTIEEREAFKKIRLSLPRELGTRDLLRFESCGTASACRFNLDGQMRTAVTGNQVGDPIYVNRDLIYSRDSAGRLFALDLGTAIAILTHELGHHQGIKDHQFLDLLGARIRIYGMLKGDVLRLDTFGDTYEPTVPPEFVLYAFHSEVNPDDDLRGPQSWLALSDGVDLFDLSPLLAAKLYCPEKGGRRGRVLGYRLYALQWVNRSHRGELIRNYEVQGSVFLVCENTDPLPGDTAPGRGDNEFKIQLTLPAQLREVPDDRRLAWRYVSEKASLQLIRR